MRRREFITLLGGAAAWPLAANAQQALPVIAVLSGGASRYPTFQRGVAETGYENERNVSIEFHSVSGRYDELPTKARELANRQVAVIAAMGIEAAHAVKEATTSIPIVFVFGVDPLNIGFVPSLNRPGGNITGMSLYTADLQEKRVDLLHELIANTASIGMIVNPRQTDTPLQVKIAETAARAKGHPLVVVRAGNADELDTAFASLSESRVGGIIVGGDNFLNSRRDQIIALAPDIFRLSALGVVYIVVLNVVPPAACQLLIGFDIPDIIELQIGDITTFGFLFRGFVGLFEAKGERLQVPQVIHVLAVIELIEISQQTLGPGRTKIAPEFQ